MDNKAADKAAKASQRKNMFQNWAIIIGIILLIVLMVRCGQGPKDNSPAGVLKSYRSKIRDNVMELASDVEHEDLLYDAGRINSEGIYSEDPVKDDDGNEYQYSYDIYYQTVTFEQDSYRFTMVIGFKDLKAVKKKQGVLLYYYSVDSGTRRNNLSAEYDYLP